MFSSVLLSIFIGCNSQEKQATPTSESPKIESKVPSNDGATEKDSTNKTEVKPSEQAEENTTEKTAEEAEQQNSEEAEENTTEKTAEEAEESKPAPKPTKGKAPKAKGKKGFVKPKPGPGVKKGPKK